jgi:hypothetical protein
MHAGAALWAAVSTGSLEGTQSQLRCKQWSVNEISNEDDRYCN